MSAARFLRPASFPRDIREERQKPTVDRILRRAANEPSAKISQSWRRPHLVESETLLCSTASRREIGMPTQLL